MEFIEIKTDIMSKHCISRWHEYKILRMPFTWRVLSHIIYTGICYWKEAPSKNMHVTKIHPTLRAVALSSAKTYSDYKQVTKIAYWNAYISVTKINRLYIFSIDDLKLSLLNVNNMYIVQNGMKIYNAIHMLGDMRMSYWSMCAICCASRSSADDVCESTTQLKILWRSFAESILTMDTSVLLKWHVNFCSMASQSNF